MRRADVGSRGRRGWATFAALAVLLSACSATATEDGLDDPSGIEAPATDGTPAGEAPGAGATGDASTGDDTAGDASGSADPDTDRPTGAESVAGQEPPPPPPGRDRLVADARALVAGTLEEAPGGTIAVLVVDEYGRDIVAHAADDAVLPASTLKVVTAAAALTTLGPRARLVTTVDGTAGVDGDGVLRGDLLVTGSGDPVLATAEYGRWVYPARPRTPLEDLADQLVEQGLRRLEGDVVANVDAFPGPRTAEGWPDRYFSSFDARYSDGLTVDAGLRTILRHPEAEPDDADGTDGTDDADPADPAASTPAGEPTPSPGDAAPADDEATDGDEATADAEQEAADLGPPTVLVDHAPEPALQAVSELIRVLEDRGVEVVGVPRIGGVDDPLVGRLASVASPPLFDLLRFAVQRSDNQMTDAIFRVVGRARTGEGSWERGDRALRQVLDRFGIDHTGAVFADGSGLSREDRITARLLVELDLAMDHSRHADAWRALMAVMGESGTLDTRLRGTPAQGRFFGKTGTLRDVTGLSGTVVTDDGASYHLAVIANDEGGGRWAARQLADDLILRLLGAPTT